MGASQSSPEGHAAAWSRSRRARVLATLAVLAVAAGGGALLVAGHRADRPQRPELQRVLDALVTGPSRIAPGATAYVSGPRGTWSGSAGVANVATGERMPLDGRFRLESVSKLWVATVVLQLAGEGKLALGDTVARRLPGLLPYGRRITLRQLLNHTSGLVDTNDIAANQALYLGLVQDRALRARLTSVSRRVAADPGLEFSPQLWVEFAAALPLLHPPGTTYHYSNIGYIVAGLVTERVTGETLADLIRTRIGERLGLESAAYDPHSVIRGDHVHGYNLAASGKATDATTWTAGLGANGGIVSDAADEGRFLTALMQGTLLAPAQLAALKTASNFSNYGLGTGVDASGCAGTAYGHNGGGPGFATSVFVSGSGDRAAVLLLNGRVAGDRGDVAAFEAMRRLYCAA